MATARLGDATYSVELARTGAERERVFSLRESEYVIAQSYLLGTAPDAPHRAADRYDDRSFIFAARRSDQHDSSPLATCRFTVSEQGRFELDDLAEGWARPPVPQDALVETSRVVVRRDVRATGLVEIMLLLAGSWLLRETPLRYNFAVCAPPLARLYARLGMGLVTENEITLRGRPVDRKYVVIYGDMKSSRPAVEARLRKRGWDISDSDDELETTTRRRAAP